jgi:Ca2+/Na+ antiporter
MGNVVGSNIVNFLIILGLSAFIGRLTVQKNTTYIEIPIALGTALLLTLMGLLNANPLTQTGCIGHTASNCRSCLGSFYIICCG